MLNWIKLFNEYYSKNHFKNKNKDNKVLIMLNSFINKIKTKKKEWIYIVGTISLFLVFNIFFYKSIFVIKTKNWKIDNMEANKYVYSLSIVLIGIFYLELLLF